MTGVVAHVCKTEKADVVVKNMSVEEEREKKT